VLIGGGGRGSVGQLYEILQATSTRVRQTKGDNDSVVTQLYGAPQNLAAAEKQIRTALVELVRHCRAER
jgi:hypothetical protein